MFSDPLSGRRVVVLIWTAFLLRAAYYCVQQPMWEGFDEWAHFAYIQHMAETGSIPQRTDPVSKEVLLSLQLAPLSKSAAESVAGAITHEEFWRLPLSDRERRQTQLRTVTAPPARLSDHQAIETLVVQYEAQQPPFYYAVLSIPYLAFRSYSLPAQVLALRLITVLIASAIVFVTYQVARLLMGGGGAPVFAVVLVASLPGFFITVCRVGNDGLAALLNGAVLLLLVKIVKQGGPMRLWIAHGLLLGIALLTKASALAFLPLAPVTAFVAARQVRSHSEKWKILARALVSIGVTGLVAGWWYWHVWHTTGTLAGEQLHVAAGAKGTLAENVGQILQVDWGRVIDSAAFTHIWVGGWSFLTLRSWMYRVFEVIALTALIGLFILLVRRNRPQPAVDNHDGSLVIAVLFYAALCAAVAYHSLVVHLAKGISTGAGWYLHAAVTAEAVLMGIGLRAFGVRVGRIALCGLCVLACALDLYTTQLILMPYHSGGGRHHWDGLRPNPGIQAMFEALAINESGSVTPLVIAAMWASYWAATLALVVVPAAALFRPPPKPIPGRLDTPPVT
ncbi:MAG: glycosyltransferase family 39 protein [Bryobacterales bacterium]|nr:glycosyltransferase family 39 protein [Bryobacterales bacterium]